MYEYMNECMKEINAWINEYMTFGMNE